MSGSAINVKDFRKIIGGVDPNDDTKYLFPEIVSESALGQKTFYRVVVRLTNAEAQCGKEFLPLKNEYFDSATKLPAGTVGYIMVLSKTGENGKIRSASPTIVRAGKNIGKANETNVFTQALRDALSKYNKQKQKSGCIKANDPAASPAASASATTDISAYTSAYTSADTTAAKSAKQSAGPTMYPPMLAQVLTDIKSLDYSQPVYVQRKYNGVRVVAMFDNTSKQVVMYSRSRKIYPGFDHIKAELKPVFEHYLREHKRAIYLDGEVYKHGVDLQTISGVARRLLKREDDSTIKLDFHMYDLFVPAEPKLGYNQRKDILDAIFSQYKFDYCKKVQTEKVESAEDVKRLYTQFLAEGYEGAMVRIDAPYKYSNNGYHSAKLLKLKPVLDREDKIVGYTAGAKGKAEGALLFILEVAPGKTITVNLGMPLEERKALYKKMSEKVEVGADAGAGSSASAKTYFEANYLGKLLNYQYDELSADGIPLRARTDGIVIRDYE